LFSREGWVVFLSDFQSKAEMNQNDILKNIIDAKNPVKFPNSAKGHICQKSPTNFAMVFNFPMVF